MHGRKNNGGRQQGLNPRTLVKGLKDDLFGFPVYAVTTRYDSASSPAGHVWGAELQDDEGTSTLTSRRGND